LQQKGQAQLSGHISFSGLDGQAAYALTNNIAILANYSDMGEKREQHSSTNYEISKHKFKEIGAGLYKKTASGNIRELFVFAGNGTTTHYVMSHNQGGVPSPKNQVVDYSRFVVQADVGNKNSKVEYILSPRILAVHYYNVVDNSTRDYRNPARFHIYAEGAATFRYPVLKFLMISGQVCGTLALTHAGVYNYYYEFAPFNYSIGLVCNMNLLKHDK
jgi:hypothetical protein